ncbi:MAG: UDP-N-acetylmuramoyl-L-alanine--D-glutamate ligase [Bacteroidales bacterium]
MSKVVILGGGESGTGAAVLAKIKGWETFLSDSNMLTSQSKELIESYWIEYEEGGHSRPKILDADLVVKSPGIPDSVPIVEEIEAAGIPIISEIEFAGRYDRSKKICVTGSNGKSTTASIIYFLLKNSGLNVALAGNIGNSYAYQVATQTFDFVVLELSSFQLDRMYHFKADIAILLNISPDHLDRYDNSIEQYIEAKFRVIQNMSKQDYFIFCADDQITVSHLDKIVTLAKELPFGQTTNSKEGAWIEEDKMVVGYRDSEYFFYLNELGLSGKHNIYNSMAAAITGKVLEIDSEVIRESLSNFVGIEHRMERVIKIKNVLYINDSKATNVNSVWYALESVEGPVVWIAGGVDKGNDYSTLEKLVRDKVKMIIALGEENSKLIEYFKEKVPQIYECSSMEDAVKEAYKVAQPGETVLLSPACASFDLFKNFEERGKKFKEALSKL